MMEQCPMTGRRIGRHLLNWLAIPLLAAACTTLPVVSAPSLSSQQIGVLQEAGFEAGDEGWEFSATNKVLFASNDATLNAEARQMLERVGKVLLGMGVWKLRIDGHSDAEGSAAYNERLSLKRAMAVAQVLTSVGFSRQQLQIRGVGAGEPVESNSNPDGRTQNRRAVIVILASPDGN